MIKRLSFLIFLSALIFNAHAQNATNAQSILDKAAAKVQSSKGINISFTLVQKNNNNQVVSDAKGTLKIKGIKYYLKQGETEIFCNGVQIWIYNGDNEVTVAKADNDDDLSPQQIITGFNKKDFDIKLLSSAGANYQVQLTPVDKRKNFKQVVLYVNKSSSLISKAIITDKTNGATEINFSNISLDTSLPDSQFVFDTSKHPGVEVINQ